MFPPSALLPFILNIACKFDSTVPCLVYVTPFYFCTRLSYTVRIFSVMFLGDAYAWATPSTLATPSLGDAFFVGDAFFPGDAFFLATPVATSNGKKIKTKNQGKVFLELLFSFYLGDLVKKPPKGKKSVPFNKTVTWLLT